MLKKASLLLVGMFLFLSIPMRAQDPVEEESTKEEIMERKLEYLKKNLQLKKEVEKEFEDVYINYSKRKRDIRKRYKKEVIQKIRKGKLDELSEEEKEKIVDVKVDIDRQRCKLNEELTSKLRKLLPPGKVINFFKFERDFNRKLMKRLREERREERREQKAKRKPRNTFNINKRRK